MSRTSSERPIHFQFTSCVYWGDSKITCSFWSCLSFQPSYHQKFKEDVNIGHVVLTVSAEDADDGMNAEIQYSLQTIGQYKSIKFSSLHLL